MALFYFKKLENRVFLFLIIFFCLYNQLFSEELPYYLPYDIYPSSTTIPKHYISVGGNLGFLNDTVDIFNLKSKFNKQFNNNNNFGNYKHNNIFLNYGLTDSTMFFGNFNSRELDYGTGKLKINSYEYSIKKSFHGVFSFQFGIKGNNAKNIKMKNVNSMNYYMKKFRKNLIIELDKNYIWITRKYPDAVLSVGFLKTEDPFFELKNMKDKTKYYRVTIGKPYDNIYPNIFFEYGKTRIHSQIDSNIVKMIPDRYKERLPKLPVDLKRYESYYKFGFSLFAKMPFNSLLQMQYSFMKFQRKNELNYIDYNHILKGMIGVFMNRHIILTFGGTLLYRQFNGEIPFLYNKYTQTTFDHPYGWIELGLILRFD